MTCSKCDRRLGCEVHGPQPRERAVHCSRCGNHTWAVNGLCDACDLAGGPPSIPVEVTVSYSIAQALGRARGIELEWTRLDLAELRRADRIVQGIAARRWARYGFPIPNESS